MQLTIRKNFMLFRLRYLMSRLNQYIFLRALMELDTLMVLKDIGQAMYLLITMVTI